MFDYVKDYGLSFNGSLQERSNTNLIVLHHSEGGSSETVKSIHEYHLSEGHKGIDYNICVEKDGTVSWGRGLATIGGHTMNKTGLPTCGVNARSVGIVCLGNFNREEMSNAPKEALKKVVADVVRYYNFNSISQIMTHKEIAGAGYTDCPGTNFPADEVREYIRSGAKTAEPTEKDPYIWQVVVNTLNFRESAGTKAKILKILHAGDEVKLSRYVEGEDWARVIVDNQEGWVWLRYIGEA